jgi:ArsR family transcriptional regulator
VKRLPAAFQRETATIAALAKLLTDSTRLQIIALLAEAPDYQKQLAARLVKVGASPVQSTLSHHLRALGDAGLVTQRKFGQRVYYRLTPAALAPLAGFLRGVADA